MNKWAAWFLIASNFISKIECAVNKNVAGPFDIVFRRVEPCPGREKDEIQYTYKLKKLNKTALAIDLDFGVTTQLDDTHKVVFSADQWANNGWKENFMRKEFNEMCKTGLTYAPSMVKRVFKDLHVKNCPIPPGNYSVKNFVLAVEIKLIPVFFYNKYRSQIELYSADNRRKVCAYIYADVVPKQRPKG